MTQAIEQDDIAIDACVNTLVPETSKFSPAIKGVDEHFSMAPSPDATDNIPAPVETCTITNELCNFDLQAGVSMIYPTNDEEKVVIDEDLLEPSSKRSHPFNMTGQFGIISDVRQ